MTEYTDDTKTITITLKAAAPPTPTTVSLEWVAENYDTDGSRRIGTSEVQQATADKARGKITIAQYNAILAAWRNSTLLPASTGGIPTSKMAKGKLINVAASSTSVTAGHHVMISCKVQNTGVSRGTFRVELTGPGTLMKTSAFYVSGNSTSPTKSLNVITPTSGTSVTYTLKCIRTT